MALVEERGLVYLDSDPEELQLPLAHVKPQPKIQYVVLSDSSDDEEDSEDEEPRAPHPIYTARVRGLQARNSLPRSIPYAQNPYTDIGGLDPQRITTTPHPHVMFDPNRDARSMHGDLSSTSLQTEIQNPLLNEYNVSKDHVKLPPHVAETDHTRFTADTRPLDIDEDEYILSLLNDFYPEYNQATEVPLRTYPGADEVSMRTHESHRDMVPLHNFDEALGVVLEVLPDICTEFVRQKYDERRTQSARVDADSLLADILSERSYPKQKVSKKRKRQDGDTEEEDMETLNSAVPHGQIVAASRVLQKQFTTMPASYIASILKKKRSPYDAIRTLLAIEKSPITSQSQSFKPLKKKRRGGSIDISDIADPTLKAQFQAAYKKITKDEEAEAMQQKQIEEDAKATERAFELHDVSECQCCFDTYPNAKMVICDGKTPHAFCTDCLVGHIKAQLDLQKHDIKCMDGSSCTAGFSRSSKQKALDTATFERWERLEQQNALRESGLPLDHCPFCDFAAICPPVDEDRELRCQAPYCGIVSCRLCKQKSHVPLTCREYKREQGFDERHKIEEEMTKALLRQCPKCKIPIYKDGGCNKITCSRCNSFICDVCGKDISKEGYKHFHRGGCAQADENTGTRRTANRVKAAEEAARNEVLAANPDLSAADLEIKAVDDIKRKERAAANLDRAREIAYRQRIRVREQRAAANNTIPGAGTIMPFEAAPRPPHLQQVPLPAPPTTPHTGNLQQPAIPPNAFVYPGMMPPVAPYQFPTYTPLPSVGPLLQHTMHYIPPMPHPLQQDAPTALPYQQVLPTVHAEGPMFHLQNMLWTYPPPPQRYGQINNQNTTQQTFAGQGQTPPLQYGRS